MAVGDLESALAALEGCDEVEGVSGETLGASCTPLVAHPATMTHAAIDPVARQTAGLVDGLLRLSVGVEALEDLHANLAAGLKRAEAVLPKHQREATAA